MLRYVIPDLSASTALVVPQNGKAVRLASALSSSNSATWTQRGVLMRLANPWL